MGKFDRKQAIEEYKSRPLNAGVFGVRCAATGGVWVGANPDLDAARNALWFLLRSGRQRNPSLQAAFNAHGEGAFVFEVLETLEPDMPDVQVADELKRKQREWAAQERAEVLLR